jgi:hypothetical protein
MALFPQVKSGFSNAEKIRHLNIGETQQSKPACLLRVGGLVGGGAAALRRCLDLPGPRFNRE